MPVIDLISKQIFNIEFQTSKPIELNNPKNEALPLKGRVVLHLPKEMLLGEREIEEIVAKMLAHQGECLKGKDPAILHTLSLEKKSRNEIVYQFDGKTHQIDPGNANQNDPLIKILAIVKEEMASSIEKTERPKSGVLDYLTHVWDLFVSALFYLFGKYTEKDLEHLNAFSARYDMNGPDKFEAVLSTFRKTVASKAKGKFNALLEQLSQAEETCFQMRKALHGGDFEIEAFSKDVATRIQQKYVANQAKEGRTNLETIPLGYYRDGIYHPLLLTFFAEEGKLKLRLVNQDPVLRENQTSKFPALKKLNPLQEFQFDSNDSDQIQKGIEGMLNVMLPFQVNGAEEAEVKVKKQGLHLLKMVQNIMGHQVLGANSTKGASQSSEEFQAPSMPEVVESVIANFGMTGSEIPESLQPYTSKKGGDWWKLCFSASQVMSQESTFGKKERIEWEIAFFQNHLNQFIEHTTGWQTLSFENKKTHLLALEKTLAKIEKSYESLYKDHAAFQKTWEDVAEESQLSAIKAAIAELKVQLAKEKLKGLDTASSASLSWQATFSVGTEIEKISSKIEFQETTPSLALAQALNTKSLQQLFQKVATEKKDEAVTNRKEFIASLDEITLEAEKAFKEKKWNQIYDFIPALLEKLPPPTISATDRFGSKVWELLTEEQIDHVSETLTKLVHHYWEAHLRLEKMSLDQGEAFAIATVRAVQIKLLREKSKRIQEKGAKSKDDKILRAFDNYTCDKAAILHLIHQNPFHRSGSNARQEERRLALEEFFIKGEGKGKPVTLDTQRGKAYIKGVSLENSSFISEVKGIAGYKSDVFGSCLERGERKPGEDVLPELLIDLRRLTVMGQYLMHPESTLHQAFDHTGALGDIERQKWLLEQFSKAASDEMSDEDASKGLFTEEWKMRMATINSMGSPIKLKIHHTSAEERTESCVAAYSGSYKLEFQPTGVLFNDNRDPYHDEVSLGKKGKLPKSFLETKIGTKDVDFKKEQFLNKDRPRDQVVKRSLTEVTTWLLEEYDPSLPELNTLLNSKLRGLEIGALDESEKASINTIYSAFEILFNRPDVLENPKVVQILELALFKTGTLQALLQKNPFYFQKGKIGQKLKFQIEQAIKREHHVALGFLLHLSDALKAQIEVAAEIASIDNHPMILGEKQGFVQKKRAVLEKIQKEMPHSGAAFSVTVEGKTHLKTGLSFLQELANNQSSPPALRKHLYTTLLAHYKRVANVDTNKFKELSPLDWAHILQAYYFTKYSGEDAGSLPLQKDIKRWFEGEALSFLTTEAMKEPLEMRKILSAHWILSETGKAEIPAELPLWEKKGEYAFSIQGKKIETSLLTGSISIDGKPSGFETAIPESILSKDEYKILFGKEVLKARVYPLTPSGDLLEYIFKKDGNEYRILQNVLEGTAQIIRKIDYKGEKREYLFQSVKESKEAAKGGAKLIERYGIWQSVISPWKGLCLVAPRALQVDEKDVIELQLKNQGGGILDVTEAETSDGRVVLQDKEHEVSTILSFSDGSDTVLIKKWGPTKQIAEVRFPSKGLSLVRGDSGKWKTKGVYKDFDLSQENADCIQLFGNDFNQFMLPIEKKNQVLGVTEKKFLIWPGELGCNSGRLKQDLLSPKINAVTATTKDASVPLLSVSMKLGEVGNGEGKLAGTASAFLYLAYASLAQGNYEGALKFLEQAESAPMAPQEKEIFEQTAERISQFDDVSKKGLSVRMKAEIVASKIKRVQLGEKTFDPNNWKKHLDKVRHQMSLYESYSQKVQEDSVSKVAKKGADQAFLLTDEERIYFETSQAESIEFLVVTLKDNDALQDVKVKKKDPHEGLIQADLQAFMKSVIYRMEKKKIEDPIGSIKSPYIGKDEFLTHFGAYWDQIAEGNLSADHWKIQKIKALVFQNASDDELKALEVGKKMLIELSKKRYKDKIPDDFYKMVNRMRELGKNTPNFFEMFLKNLFKMLSYHFQFVKDFLDLFNIDVNDQSYTEDKVIAAAVAFARCKFPEKMDYPKVDKVENIEFATTIAQVKQELKKNESLFSSEEKLLWEIGIDLIKKEVNTDHEQADLIKIIVGGLNYKIHVLAMRHTAEQMKKVSLLEKNGGKPQEKFEAKGVQVDPECGLLNLKASWLKPLEEQVFHLDPGEIQEKENEILKLAEHVKEKYVASKGSDLEEMEKEENALRVKGVELAAKRRIEELKQSPGIIREGSLKILKASLQTKIESGKQSCSHLHQEILKAAKEQCKEIPEIESMFRRHWMYNDADIFEKLVDLFQEQKFPGNNWDALEQNVLKYLLQATEVQQLQEASKKLMDLKALKKQGKMNDPKKKEQIAVDWEMTSKALHSHLVAAVSTDRYLDPAGALQKPDLSRKFLATEYRLGVVLRKDQTNTVEIMRNSPNKAVLRPPGFGKSKAVFPPLLAILAADGRFPVVLETEELCRIAETDLDKMNRMIFNQARHKFRFHSSNSIEPSELVDEYSRLLQAKKEKGYIVTSIESLAALDNTLVRLGKELKEKFLKTQEAKKGDSLDKLKNSDDLLSALMDLKATQEKRHWLTKIREVIHSGQFVADEVDDIFDVNRWVNEAIDSHEPPSRKLTRGTGYMFQTIMESLETNSDLKQLAHALLCNGQANFNKDQIGNYMKLLAEVIYDKEGPFDLKKKEWDALKATVTKQEFVDFVTGKPGAKIGLAWDDSKDMTLLEYVGILKHQMTKGLPTVLGEEIDIDFGLNEDGCTIEPLKKGEKLPNTRHGNPYELVGYHFAYYASRVPEWEFFEREWQKIQTQITQGTADSEWSAWYKSAQVTSLPPKEQVEVLYKHLQKPESWRVRQMLLSDAAMDHVRLFPYQFKCNVQDPLIDEDITLGGASGTVNFYALPGTFEKDESVDSREVSGSIDLSLAEMSAKGLDQEIGIFNGNGALNGREKIKELALDLGCKSIINQGGAMEGKNSLMVAKFLRKQLSKAGVERQVLFVDPKTRQQMMWDPEEGQPVAFDPSKLRPNYLVYFGPPDTRGTDFPIELGTAGFICGKTMDEEQRQQATLRLRKFGKGQTVKVFMHQSIQRSLNIKLARDENHPVTLSEMINDVKRKSLEKKSESNWKGAVRKTQSPILRQVKAAWFKSSIDDLDAHWKVDTENNSQKDKDFERILTSIAYDVSLFEVFEKAFISKRELDFKKDFEPVEHVAATKEIESHFDLNLQKAKDLAKAFENVSSGARIVEILRLFNTGEALDYKQLAFEHLNSNLPKMSKDDVKALISVIAPQQAVQVAPMLDMLWLFQPDPVARAQAILAHAQPMLEQLTEAQIKEFLNQEKIFVKEQMVDEKVAEKLEAIQKSLDSLNETIAKEKERFLKEEASSQLHSKNLKKLVPKSHDVDSNSQEQVQQQQQQQQMESQQISKKKKEAEEIKDKHTWTDWVSSFKASPQEKSESALHMLKNGGMGPHFPSLDNGATSLTGIGGDFGFDKNLKVSVNQLNLLRARKVLEGEAADRVAVIKHPQGGHPLQFYAIDMQDQNRGFSPAIQAINENKAAGDLNCEVHSIRSDLSDKTFGATDFLEGAGSSIVKHEEAAFLRGLVQMKVFMGAIHFSSSEEKALKLWLNGLNVSQTENLTKLICKIHDVDRVSQIRGWDKSSLKEVIA